MDNTVTGLTTVRHDLVPFLAFPSRHQNDLSRRQCLIYMIPGNPGLVAYYEPFLRALRQLLDEREREAGCRYAFHIYGRSLLGFDDGDHEPRFGTITASGATTEPFTLEDQIRGVCGGIQGVNSGTLGDGRTFDQVILIGHSVGAYIALETFHRHHQARREIACTSDSLTSVNLKSGILLFPTVSHIAQSSSGQKLNRLRTTPLLDRTAHHVAKGFVSLWPVWILDAIVRRVMGFPDHAVATTLRFLTSADGIWQALHMGKDEMRCITEEKWGEELWEIQEAEAEPNTDAGKGCGNGDEKPGFDGTKFFFYFAEKDHWVADECRDEFIERRKRHGKGRTKIIIDETGIPHAFCIHHSESVAEKVKAWVEDIVGL
ncbi:hypothetical protein VTH82DRAFT_5476 [Thermothelomyces myriococcoides]